jgi:uncharacterized membrane protein YeaQ/YmgE (transglycosylase-associated protein family)
MSLLTSLAVGGLIGWLARMLAVGQPGLNMAVSVVVGAIGALLSAWLISPLVGIVPASQDNFSLMAVALAVIGALLLLGVVDLARRVGSR